MLQLSAIRPNGKLLLAPAVATTATACSKTTDPASPLASTGSEIVSHKTHVCNKPVNPSTLPSLPASNGLVPHKTEGFDEGHLHRALPIHGLPLEEKPHINNTRLVKQVMQPNHQCEEHSMAKARKKAKNWILSFLVLSISPQEISAQTNHQCWNQLKKHVNWLH